MKCPVCGGAELVSVTRDVSYTYKGEVACISAVAGLFCLACSEAVLDFTESERFASAVRSFNQQVNEAIVDRSLL